MYIYVPSQQPSVPPCKAQADEGIRPLARSPRTVRPVVRQNKIQWLGNMGPSEGATWGICGIYVMFCCRFRIVGFTGNPVTYS